MDAHLRITTRTRRVLLAAALPAVLLATPFSVRVALGSGPDTGVVPAGRAVVTGSAPAGSVASWSPPTTGDPTRRAEQRAACPGGDHDRSTSGGSEAAPAV